MKNTNITNKYVLAAGILLIAAVFSVALPAFAQSVDTGGYNDAYTGGYNDAYTGGYNDAYTGGYNDAYTGGYSLPTSQTTYSVSSDQYYVSGGGFSGGLGYGGYSGSYVYPGSTVTSGSFSGGITYLVNTPAYNYPGSTVNSGTYYANAYNGVYGTLNGSCSSSFNTGANGGPMVTWTGLASGGNGSYSYYWTGDEALSGSGQYISKTYVSSGVKNAYLTITSSDGQTISRTCSATVGNGNQVLAYSATNPNLQSVYLSNVPYTGAGDTMKVIGFISILLLWSAGLSYIFLKRKEQENAVAVSVVTTDAGDNAKMFEKFSMDIHSDNQAIESIETFARMNQVLLSSDAVRELAKLSRLNRVKPKEVIEKMSTGEWTTVGENDLQKYL